MLSLYQSYRLGMSKDKEIDAALSSEESHNRLSVRYAVQTGPNIGTTNQYFPPATVPHGEALDKPPAARRPLPSYTFLVPRGRGATKRDAERTCPDVGTPATS